ncbi:Fc.00g046870.m01.CDS01 [Cosmosporella sp. VM-42]
MATYTVNIEIAGSNSTTNKTLLCVFASAWRLKMRWVKNVYNVIAKTYDTFEPTMKFAWSDNYSIKGTEQAFSRGAQVQTDGLTDISRGTEDDVIGFSNSLSCNIVLAVKVDEENAPIYFGKGLVASGEASLNHGLKVAIWWQDAA